MTNETRRWIEGSVFFLLFCLTIPMANWMITNVGTVCTRDGPCLIPVAPGLLAPSGVLMVGIRSCSSRSCAAATRVLEQPSLLS